MLYNVRGKACQMRLYQMLLKHLSNAKLESWHKSQDYNVQSIHEVVSCMM